MIHWTNAGAAISHQTNILTRTSFSLIAVWRGNIFKIVLIWSLMHIIYATLAQVSSPPPKMSIGRCLSSQMRADSICLTTMGVLEFGGQTSACLKRRVRELYSRHVISGTTQQTRGIDPALIRCCCDVGSPTIWRWLNITTTREHYNAMFAWLPSLTLPDKSRTVTLLICSLTLIFWFSSTSTSWRAISQQIFLSGSGMSESASQFLSAEWA